jgi:hypothetical protein
MIKSGVVDNFYRKLPNSNINQFYKFLRYRIILKILKLTMDRIYLCVDESKNNTVRNFTCKQFNSYAAADKFHQENCDPTRLSTMIPVNYFLRVKFIDNLVLQYTLRKMFVKSEIKDFTQRSQN